MASDTDQAIAEATRWLIEQQLLVRAPKREPLPTPIASGGGMPTVTVAASDASAISKAKADLICTGVDDQVTFRRAFTLATDWGRVNLTEGDYFCTVDLPRTLDFEGIISGVGQRGTFIFATGGNVGDEFIFLDSGAEIRDLYVQADNSDAHMVRAAGNKSVISRCWIIAETGYGVRVTSGVDISWIQDSHISSGSSTAIRLDSGFNLHISNNMIEGSDYGIRDAGFGDGLRIGGNYILGDSAGIWLASGDDAQIFGNNLVGQVGPSLQIDAGSSRAQVVGNEMLGRGLYLNGCQHVVIASNMIESTQHGVRFNGAKWCTVTGNDIPNPGSATNNTYDGLFFEGDSDNNNVQDNGITTPAAGNRARYASNVSAGTCNSNVVNGNVAGPAANFATGVYNNAGTGTQGANFTT